MIERSTMKHVKRGYENGVYRLKRKKKLGNNAEGVIFPRTNKGRGSRWLDYEQRGKKK